MVQPIRLYAQDSYIWVPLEEAEDVARLLALPLAAAELRHDLAYAYDGVVPAEVQSVVAHLEADGRDGDGACGAGAGAC